MRLHSNILIPCDVTDSASMIDTFERLKKEWGNIDFLVHAIGFSDKEELRGKYYITSSDNFNSGTLSIL